MCQIINIFKNENYEVQVTDIYIKYYQNSHYSLSGWFSCGDKSLINCTSNHSIVKVAPPVNALLSHITMIAFAIFRDGLASCLSDATLTISKMLLFTKTTSNTGNHL